MSLMPKSCPGCTAMSCEVCNPPLTASQIGIIHPMTDQRAEYMTNQESSVELKACCPACKSTNLKIETWQSADCAVFDAAECLDCHTKVNDVRKWNTRAQAPDGGDIDYCAMFISLCKGLELDPRIVGTCTPEGLEAIGSKIAQQAKAISPTPQEADRGELINKALLEAASLEHWSQDLLAIAKSECVKICESDQCCKERYNAGQLDDAVRVIRELCTALQSTPPQQAEGELVERIVALMDAVKKKRIDPVLGDVEDDIYNTLKDCLTALQQRSGQVGISRGRAEKFVSDFEGIPQDKLMKLDRKYGAGISEMYLELKQSLEASNERGE